MGKRKNVILPPDLPPEIGEDEIHVSDEDLEFVRANRDYAGFLTNLDTKLIDRHVIRVADQKEDNLEALYEKRKKRASLQKPVVEDELEVDPVDALPVKTLDGELYYRTSKKSRSDKTHNEEEEVAEVDKDGKADRSIVRLTKAERRQKLKKSKKEAKKQAKEEVKTDTSEESLRVEVLAKVQKELSAEEAFTTKKNKLAEVGIALLEDPDSNIKFLKDLVQFCSDEDQHVVKLGLLSLLAVFKDIIPGYRIRLPTEKELQMTVSKTVQKMRFYESTLLRSYKAYLVRLLDLERKPTFQHVAIRCMCNLIDAVPHFNFRETLLAGVVKNISSSDDVVRKLCCGAIKSLFGNEGKHGGEATLEAVHLIAGLVRSHDCQLHPDCIEVFLSLKFDEDLGTSEPLEEKVKPKKKRQWKKVDTANRLPVNDRKLSKQELAAKTREEVNADFKATSFIPDSVEQRRMQSETLSVVFQTYFRILKHSMDPAISRSKVNTTSLNGGSGARPLLAPCLNGLGKFSHLIDLDFLSDLMGCLRKLAGYGGGLNVSSSESILSVSERLQCCIVAVKVMRNNLDALNVDLHEFFVQLYNLLLEYRPDRDRGDVLTEALKTMLCEGRQHDMQRAAAFIKRLATFSLCFGSAEAMAALVTLKHILQKNTKCRSLLENDVGGGSLSGLVAKYQPDAQDPNLSGAPASVLWELSLLAKHYHPTISSMASSISSMATNNQVYISSTSPRQAFEDLSIEREAFKPTLKPSSLNCKRKRDRRSGSSYESPLHGFQNPDFSADDDDDVEGKLENHFTVLRDITENERLRLELSRTVSYLGLYEEHKKQKRMKKDRLKLGRGEKGT